MKNSEQTILDTLASVRNHENQVGKLFTTFERLDA